MNDEDKIKQLQEVIDRMQASLDFYMIDVRCPKCFHYHAKDHICFNCGYDDSIGEYRNE